MHRRAILAGLLAVPLVVGSAVPALAQDATASPEPEVVSMAEVSVASLFEALNAMPAVVFPDAPAPDSVAAFVPVAREQLRAVATASPQLPLHLRFLDARCGADGTGVALVFAELRPPYLLPTFAVAWRDLLPASTADEWGTATGLFSVQEHELLTGTVGRDSVACP